MVCRLDDELWFPDPRYGDDDGCIAVGGDLSVDRLLLAYQNGIFPWFAFRYNEPMWFCPMERFVIFPSEIHVSHSMRTLMNKGQYRLSINEDFKGVIGNCSRLRIEESGAWLGPQMVDAYTELHRQGFAAMFSLVPSASKLALIHLARTMQENGGLLIDCQFHTPHLESMGGRHIKYDEYMKIISAE